MSRTVIHIEKAELDHPVEHVWSLVSSFGAIKAWMPAVKWCMTDGHNVGSVRTVCSLAGEAKEKLEVLDDESHTISYRVLDPIALPMTGSRGTWKLERCSGSGEDKERTNLTWIADAETVDPEGLATLQLLCEGFMKNCLSGLKNALAEG